jgi:hypothetical protein
MTGQLSIAANTRMYAGNNDFAYVAATGAPTAGAFMLQTNKIGSSAGTNDKLFGTYYYANDTGAITTNSPRIPNSIQSVVTTTPGNTNGVWTLAVGCTTAQLAGNWGLNGSLCEDLQIVRAPTTGGGIKSLILNTTVSATLGSPNNTISVAAVDNAGPIYMTAPPPKLQTAVSVVGNTPVTVTTTAASTASQTITVGSTSGILAGMFLWSNSLSFYAYVTAASGTTITVSNPVTCISGATFNVGWVKRVKVGSNFYHIVSASAATGAGTLTFAEPVSVADGTAGNKVTGAQDGSPSWVSVMSYVDQTELPASASGIIQMLEMDLSCNGGEDDTNSNQWVYSPYSGYAVPQGYRNFICMNATQHNSGGAPAVIGSGLTINALGSGVSFNSMIQCAGNVNQAVLDTRKVSQQTGANTIWLTEGQTIALDSAGTTISKRVSDHRIIVTNSSGTVVFSIDPANGNVRALGTITGSTTP